MGGCHHGCGGFGPFRVALCVAEGGASVTVCGCIMLLKSRIFGILARTQLRRFKGILIEYVRFRCQFVGVRVSAVWIGHAHENACTPRLDALLIRRCTRRLFAVHALLSVYGNLDCRAWIVSHWVCPVRAESCGTWSGLACSVPHA